jgi:hypothetical protein
MSGAEKTTGDEENDHRPSERFVLFAHVPSGSFLLIGNFCRTPETNVS